MSEGVLVIPTRVIRTCFALVGFAAATVFGILAGNTPATILWRALAVMCVALVIGHVVGHFAQRTVDEFIARYKEQHPIPKPESSMNESSGETPPDVTNM